MRPQIHLIDETWIDAPAETVSAVVADPANWRRWWPHLELTVTRDRRLKGMQWAARPVRPEDASEAPAARPSGVRSAAARSAATLAGVRSVAIRPAATDLAGTVEIWLEPYRTGVILHHYLRLDPADSRPLSRRAAAATTRRLAWHAKQVFWSLKDELEQRR